MTWIERSNRYLLCALIVIAFTVTSCSAATSHVGQAGSVDMKDAKFAGPGLQINEKSMVNQNGSGNNSNPGGGNGTGNGSSEWKLHTTYSSSYSLHTPGADQGGLYAPGNGSGNGSSDWKYHATYSSSNGYRTQGTDQGGLNAPGNGSGNGTGNWTMHTAYSSSYGYRNSGVDQGGVYAPVMPSDDEQTQMAGMGPSSGSITEPGPLMWSGPAGC